MTLTTTNLNCPGYKRKGWFKKKCKHYVEIWQVFNKQWDRFCNHPEVEQVRGNLCSYHCPTNGMKPKE